MQLSAALMMGMLLFGGDNDGAPLRKQSSILNAPTPVTVVSDEAPVSMWSQTEPGSTAAYYMESHAEHAVSGGYAGGSCSHCDASCGLFGCRHGGGMLHLFRSPGDMPMHIPYIAEPKNFYYFRAYNWFHIPEHQRDVTFHNPPGDLRDPYDTRFLQDIYIQLEQKYGGIEVVPGTSGQGGGSPNDLPPVGGGNLLLKTYGNQNHGDFDAPAIFPASARRGVK